MSEEWRRKAEELEAIAEWMFAESRRLVLERERDLLADAAYYVSDAAKTIREMTK